MFRRVVPSPAPTAILEAAQIRTLIDAGAVVIAAGGGGIPLVRRDGQWAAVDAVIDKDRASALLAAETGVDTLVLVTGVDEVCVDFGRPTQRALHDVTAGRDAGPPRRRASSPRAPWARRSSPRCASSTAAGAGRSSPRSNACRTHWPDKAGTHHRVGRP